MCIVMPAFFGVKAGIPGSAGSSQPDIARCP